jgi:hypothetical protein
MDDSVAQFGQKVATIALDKSAAYSEYLKFTLKSGRCTATAADPGACARGFAQRHFDYPESSNKGAEPFLGRKSRSRQ